MFATLSVEAFGVSQRENTPFRGAATGAVAPTSVVDDRADDTCDVPLLANLSRPSGNTVLNSLSHCEPWYR